VKDDLDRWAEDGSELWGAGVAAERRADAPPANVSSIVPCEIAAMTRRRDYQRQIERASALLCKAQPDMIAGETVAIRETELPRSNWPFIIALGASLLFWLCIGWSMTAVM
jgi:hypothetical protein